MADDNGYGGGSVGWFLVGSLAGACAVLLLAPARGSRTREGLGRRLRDTRESVTGFIDGLAETTRHIAEQAGRISDTAVRVAGGASAAAREVRAALTSDENR